MSVFSKLKFFQLFCKFESFHNTILDKKKKKEEEEEMPNSLNFLSLNLAESLTVQI
jgi:hypothetical protein